MLTCRGDEDRATQSRRRPSLSRALQGSEHLTVDLSDLVFADSSLMLDLVMLARRLGERHRMVSLRGAQPQIRRLIEMLGVHRLPGLAVEGLEPSPRPGRTPACRPGARPSPA